MPSPDPRIAHIRRVSDAQLNGIDLKPVVIDLPDPAVVVAKSSRASVARSAAEFRKRVLVNSAGPWHTLASVSSLHHCHCSGMRHIASRIGR